MLAAVADMEETCIITSTKTAQHNQAFNAISSLLNSPGSATNNYYNVQIPSEYIKNIIGDFGRVRSETCSLIPRGELSVRNSFIATAAEIQSFLTALQSDSNDKIAATSQITTNISTIKQTILSQI